MKAKRLVCVVEGHGEVKAVPNLCERIRLYLGVQGWVVDPDPVRQPRGRLVDESQPSPRRSAAQDGLCRAVMLARRRPADGVLVLCDQDDDCPATWGPDARALVSAIVPGSAVMAVREYETWLIYSFPEHELRARRITAPERKRDAKRLLKQLCPGYKPSTHQLRLTRGIDIAHVRARSNSFDSLVRCLASVFGVPAPPRGDPKPKKQRREQDDDGLSGPGFAGFHGRRVPEPILPAKPDNLTPLSTRFRCPSAKRPT